MWPLIKTVGNRALAAIEEASQNEGENLNEIEVKFTSKSFTRKLEAAKQEPVIKSTAV